MKKRKSESALHDSPWVTGEHWDTARLPVRLERKTWSPYSGRGGGRPCRHSSLQTHGDFVQTSPAVPPKRFPGGGVLIRNTVRRECFTKLIGGTSSFPWHPDMKHREAEPRREEERPPECTQGSVGELLSASTGLWAAKCERISHTFASHKNHCLKTNFFISPFFF